jgi:hypothetical protein
VFEGLLIGGVVPIIVNLVVRDQMQFRVSRLKSDLLGLRSEEKRLPERRDEVELMVAQIADALMRADRRKQSLEKGCGVLQAQLDDIQALISDDNSAA